MPLPLFGDMPVEKIGKNKRHLTGQW